MEKFALAKIEKAIRRAAEEAYEREIVETEMEEMESEDSGFTSKEIFKEDWIESKILGWEEVENVKIVINTCYGGFGLSKKAYKKLGLKWDGYGYAYDRWDERTKPELIKVVEELGSEANGEHADLKIVVIPEDVDWILEEHGGIERIAERHRTWG